MGTICEPGNQGFTHRCYRTRFDGVARRRVNLPISGLSRAGYGLSFGRRTAKAATPVTQSRSLSIRPTILLVARRLPIGAHRKRSG